MGSISDNMLADGVTQVESLHGEMIRVLTGRDAGKSFLGVIELETDVVFDHEIGPDPRARRMVRFRVAPDLTKQDIVQTDNGRKWHAVKSPGGTYLTTDFELVEIADCDE